jgi:hypothetical protein
VGRDELLARTHALVRADALFEGVLGLVLLLGVATGALDGGDFPAPVGTVVLLLAGWLLLMLCGLIWSGRLGLWALAAGNAVSAAAGLLWLLLADGWSTAGAVLIAITVALLAGLAAAQAATLRA